MDIKYNITYHAVERLQERFGAFCAKIPLLKNWKREKGLGQLKPLFSQMLELSQENKSYLNNSAYMLNLYEKYGYDNEYCFLEFKEENILFLLTKTRSAKDYLLVTLMPTEYRPTVKNTKYNGKQEREISFNKFLMNWSKSEILLSHPAKKDIVKKQPVALMEKKEEGQKKELNKTIKEIDIVEKNIEKENVIKDRATIILHDTLIDSIKKSTAIQLERISNTKAIYITLIDNYEYEFTYSRTSSGVRNIMIHNKTQINLHNEIRALEPKTYFYETILKSINNNEAILTSEKDIEGKIYNVQLYTHVHNVRLIENGSDSPNIILQQNKTTMTNMKVNTEELKSSGEKLKDNDPVYAKIMETMHSQQFKVIEKYSGTTSLRISTIDDIDYQYIYINRSKKDKDIILQETRKRGNNVSLKAFEKISQLASQSLDNVEKVKIRM